MNERMRWTDDRLDDMAKTVERTTERLDATQNIVAAHDLQLVEINREKNTKGEHRFALIAVGLTVFLGELAQVVATILTHH